MKILFSHHLTNREHPAAQAVENIATALGKRGHDVRVHAPGIRQAPQALPGASAPARSPLRKLGAFRELWRDRKRGPIDRQAIHDFQPDLVVSRQDAYRNSMENAARDLGVPLVVFADAPVAHETRHFDRSGRWHPPRLVESIERAGLLKANRVVTVSYPTARILGRYEKIPPIHVIPNGIHADRFGPDKMAEGRELRRKLVPEGKKSIGFLGSFRPFHGTDLLASLIRKSGSRQDLHWLLVGDGPDLPKAVAAAREAGVSHTVTGWIKPEQAPAHLAAIDLLVAPHPMLGPEFYFSPLKILEGAAAGCALLATRQGDIPGYLSLEQHPFLLETNHPDIWWESLSAMLDSVDLKKLGQANHRQVIRRFSWDAAAAEWERILNLVPFGTPHAEAIPGRGLQSGYSRPALWGNRSCSRPKASTGKTPSA